MKVCLKFFAYFSNARETDTSVVLNAEFRSFINPVEKTKLSCSLFLSCFGLFFSIMFHVSVLFS